ncbi:MAG: C45 family peptidase [Clostridia bacterium]
MKKLLALVIVLAMVFSCTLSCAETALSISSPVAAFEQGTLVKQGAITVVDLHGTWREMGRQYGQLLSAELAEVTAFVEAIMNAKEGNAEKAQNIADLQEYQTPYTVRQFFVGMAETSGLTEKQLYLANAVERIAGLPQCSAAAVWDDYTDGALIFGRNYDYGEAFFSLKNDVVVAVYHPADGSLATATIGYAGEIYAVNGINEKGIFLELNNGKPSANIKSPVARITGTTLLFDVLFEADSLNFVDLFFDTALCSSSYIINVADSETAHSYEWCPIGVERGDAATPDGLLVSTNHYVSENWEFATPTDEESWMSLTRRKNLIDQCTQSKGAIDAARMMEIIGTSKEDGGSMNEFTVYQMVVIPETLTLWLRVTDATPWTEIDLGSFLRQ